MNYSETVLCFLQYIGEDGRKSKVGAISFIERELAIVCYPSLYLFWKLVLMFLVLL